jgi:hypothetical protein
MADESKKNKTSQVEGAASPETHLIGKLFRDPADITPDEAVKLAGMIKSITAEPFKVLAGILNDIQNDATKLDPLIEITEGMTLMNLWETAEKNNSPVHKVFEKVFFTQTENGEKNADLSKGVIDLRDALRDEVERRQRIAKNEKLDRLELARHQPLAKGINLRFSSTNINKLFVESLMPGAMKEFTDVQDSLEGLKNKTLLDALQFKTAYIGHSKSDLEGVVGFKYDLGSEMKDILENESALLTKAHYVLSERFYEQTGGEGSGQSAITLNQFCDDLGMPRKNGAHTPRNKERARSVFEVLTSTRISALAYLNGKKSPLRISDNMWKQGAEIEVQKRGRWHEHILTFTRGGFDDEWQKQNKKFIGYIHRGFLELKADNQDKYAILLGGYLASFAKMNQYQIQPLKLLPILKRVGLWNVYAEATPGKMREKLERSLDKLVSVGILREWRIEELSNVTRVVKQMSKAINYEEDYDEVGDNEHEAEPDKWVKVWLNKRLVIAYPFEFDERGKINKEKRVIYIKHNQKLKEKKRLSANKGSQTF